MFLCVAVVTGAKQLSTVNKTNHILLIIIKLALGLKRDVRRSRVPTQGI